MKIFNAEQIKKCDSVTCENQNIQIRELINRAGNSFVEMLTATDADLSGKIFVICGYGNNGADGIAIAKLLYARYCDIELLLIPAESKKLNSEYMQFYLDNPVDSQPFPVHIIKKINQLNDLEKPDLIIDAILGTGTTRAVEGIIDEVISWMNTENAKVVSVDIPSGICADKILDGNAVEAELTITFQFPKFTFFLPEYAKNTGRWMVADIGCDQDFLHNEPAEYHWIDKQLVLQHLKVCDRFAHKGNFGHAYIISGSYGKLGATIMCSKAVLRTGSGLATIHAPACAYEILQMAIPEAMVDVDRHKYFISEVNIPARCTAVAIGPGIGTQHHTQRMLDELFHKNITIPVVLDADALNLMSMYPEIIRNLPKESILTPHVKEFERLFGPTATYSDQIKLQKQKSAELNAYIILKGGYTTLSCPDGEVYFNTNGNPGMATGGSGDVLTGIITGLAAQGYSRKEACIIGIFLHGMSGDLAVQGGQSYESLLASDLIDNIGHTFRKIRQS